MQPRTLARWLIAAVVGGVALISGMTAADYAGLRVNTSASMPRGVWRVAWTSGPLRHGDVIALCLPEDTAREAAQRRYIATGPCPGGYEPLIKPVAAIGGDSVAVSRERIAINGEPVSGTAQLAHDSIGRPLRPVDQGQYRVSEGEVWVLSGHDQRSFDSRYFGPVPLSKVRGVARPVWVIE